MLDRGRQITHINERLAQCEVRTRIRRVDLQRSPVMSGPITLMLVTKATSRQKNRPNTMSL